LSGDTAVQLERNSIILCIDAMGVGEGDPSRNLEIIAMGIEPNFAALLAEIKAARSDGPAGDQF
jgi:hypothetical protein